MGVPGLINAYKTAAEEALKLATVIEKTVNDVYVITFDYLQMNDIMRIIKDDSLTITEQSFDNNCSITVAIRQMQVNQSLAKLNKVDGVKTTYKHSL